MMGLEAVVWIVRLGGLLTLAKRAGRENWRMGKFFFALAAQRPTARFCSPAGRSSIISAPGFREKGIFRRIFVKTPTLTGTAPSSPKPEKFRLKRISAAASSYLKQIGVEDFKDGHSLNESPPQLPLAIAESP